MSLVFFDGFDHYSTLSHKGWTVTAGGTTGITASAVRYGLNGFRCESGSGNSRGMFRLLDTGDDEIIFGFALRLASSPTSGRWVARAGANGIGNHIGIAIAAGPVLRVDYQTSTASGTTVLSLSTWYYVEVRLKVHDTAGEVEVRLNGSVEINVSGIDTKSGAGTVADYVGLGHLGGSTSGSSQLLDFDDFYLILKDGSGAVDFLGDVRAAALLPDGNGNSQQFVGQDGNSTDNYLNADETAPDGDTTYNESSTTGHKDLHTHANLPTAASAVHGVQQMIYARKTDVGARTGRMVVRSNGTDYEGSDLTMLDTYQYFRQMRTVDPDTSAAWTASAVDAIESGSKVQA